MKKLFKSIKHNVHPIGGQSSKLVDHSLIAFVALAISVSLCRYDNSDGDVIQHVSVGMEVVCDRHIFGLLNPS